MFAKKFTASGRLLLLLNLLTQEGRNTPLLLYHPYYYYIHTPFYSPLLITSNFLHPLLLQQPSLKTLLPCFCFQFLYKCFYLCNFIRIIRRSKPDKIFIILYRLLILAKFRQYNPFVIPCLCISRIYLNCLVIAGYRFVILAEFRQYNPFVIPCLCIPRIYLNCPVITNYHILML